MGLRSRRGPRPSKENGELIHNGASKQSLVPERVLVEKRNQMVVGGKPTAKAALPRSYPVKHPEISGIERELSAAEYTDDVHKYLLSREAEFKSKFKFSEASVITPPMRSILIDWLVQVHGRFSLFPETLHLAVYLVDCAIANLQIDKPELQLVGVASMIVAAKFEEVYAPVLADYEYIADNTYNRRQIVQMEMKVLQACNFAFVRPHSIIFLRWLSREVGIGNKEHAIAKYLGEVALLDYSLAPYLPSQIAAISLFIAGRLTRGNVDVDKIMNLIDWNRSEMEAGARVLSHATLRFHNQGKLVALRVKYSTIKQGGVSNFSRDDLVLLEDF